MTTFFEFITSYVSILDVIDVALVSYVIYRLLLLLRGTRAIDMLVTIMILMLILGLSDFVGLKLTGWILSNLSGYFFLALIIIFHPELRRALAFIGESKFFERTVSLNSQIVDELVRTATILANRQLGALIIIQRNTDISHYVTLGQKIDSVVSKDLLLSIFIPYSPLHDGAVLLEGTRLTYAGCILPLTKREDIAMQYGTRHRAAIGITEETDAVAIVVSEERGEISVTVGGDIYPNLDANSLKETLSEIIKINKSSED